MTFTEYWKDYGYKTDNDEMRQIAMDAWFAGKLDGIERFSQAMKDVTPEAA